MAIDAYMYFLQYNNVGFLTSESQAQRGKGQDPMFESFGFKEAYGKNGIFEVEDFSFDVEQTLNIGSQSSGAGAGRITFNPFSITRKIDCASPILLQMACAGTTFEKVALGARKSSGGDQAGTIYLVFLFKLVAVKTIGWSYDDESPKETTTFEYGGLQVHYTVQNPDGKPGKTIPGGWNKVTNLKDDDPKSVLNPPK